MSAMKPIELYFHIPFCVRKCLYCDFLSFPGERRTIEAYMRALCTELEERADEYRESLVSSVFIGGGTPSVAEPGLVEELLKRVHTLFCVEDGAEITLEMNPGTADGESMKRYRRAGINRLSMGLQSAWDRELKRLGRIHTFGEFLECYAAAFSAGFDNISLDLMFGLPGQTQEDWRGTLKRVLALRPLPAHISAYSLIVEEGTPFYALQEQGKLSLPEEDCERQMYADTEKILGSAGFFRYEISNYAREGYECRHNCGYWQRRDYIGFGIGAASLFQNTRFRNGSDLQEYLRSPGALREAEEVLDKRAQMEEFMFLGLRKMRGVSGRVFRETFGEGLEAVYGDILSRNERDGLLYRREEPGDVFWALTVRGIDVSNYVMSQFLFG